MMRAKLVVQNVIKVGEGQENINMSAVTNSNKPYGPKGENEDNTFARYTPSAQLSMSITNPALFGKIKPGQKFYVDFTEAPE